MINSKNDGTPIETALISTKVIDPSMKLFTAIAMILVVVGHINQAGFRGPFDLFPPYSFHVAAFVFVSGYFYNSEKAEHSCGGYLLKKAKRLLFPLYLVNFVYGCISYLLLLAGFEWGTPPRIQLHYRSTYERTPVLD